MSTDRRHSTRMRSPAQHYTVHDRLQNSRIDEFEDNSKDSIYVVSAEKKLEFAQASCRHHASILQKTCKNIMHEYSSDNFASIEGVQKSTESLLKTTRRAAAALRRLDAEIEILAQDDLQKDDYKEELAKEDLLCCVSNFPLRDAMRLTDGRIVSKEGAQLLGMDIRTRSSAPRGRGRPPKKTTWRPDKETRGRWASFARRIARRLGNHLVVKGLVREARAEDWKDMQIGDLGMGNVAAREKIMAWQRAAIALCAKFRDARNARQLREAIAYAEQYAEAMERHLRGARAAVRHALAERDEHALGKMLCPIDHAVAQDPVLAPDGYF